MSTCPFDRLVSAGSNNDNALDASVFGFSWRTRLVGVECVACVSAHVRYRNNKEIVAIAPRLTMIRCADVIFGERLSLKATSKPIIAAIATSGPPTNIPSATDGAEARPGGGLQHCR